MGKFAFDCDMEYSLGIEAKTIVLVGRTGNGKSATGNSIIGGNVFDSMTSPVLVTTTCQLQSNILDDDQILNVIDTPGLYDTSVEPEIIGKEFAKCINMAKSGIHAIVVVLSLGTRFSQEEASTIESLVQFFGDKIYDYMIVAFAHGDALGEMSLDDYLSRNCIEPLKKTLEMCGNRHVLFDNVTEDEIKKTQQRKKLLRLVDAVVDSNGGIPYTTVLFVKVKLNSPEYWMEFNKAYKEKLGLGLKMAASICCVSALKLEKDSALEQISRMEAVQMKSNDEISKLWKSLKIAQGAARKLRKSYRETKEKLENKTRGKMDVEIQKKNNSLVTLIIKHQV